MGILCWQTALLLSASVVSLTCTYCNITRHSASLFTKTNRLVWRL